MWQRMLPIVSLYRILIKKIESRLCHLLPLLRMRLCHPAGCSQCHGENQSNKKISQNWYPKFRQRLSVIVHAVLAWPLVACLRLVSSSAGRCDLGDRSSVACSNVTSAPEMGLIFRYDLGVAVPSAAAGERMKKAQG